MKYQYKTVLFILLFITCLGMSPALKAQDNTRYNWQIGFGIGYTNYFGDVSNYRINGSNQLYKVYKFVQYNPYYQHQPSLSILLQKKITPTLGIMFQANYLQFGMSDRYRKNSGELDTAALNYARSLNFRTTMQDVGLAFTFSPNNGRIGSETAFFYPSFYVGAGVSKFQVKGDLYDGDNAPYNYRLPGVINDGAYETNLRDQQTETDERFTNVVPYVDLGLALNFRINDLLTIALQSDIKFSASDYLDDVSAKYRSSYPTPAAAYVAKPGYNTVDPLTMKRGDDNGVNDFYINNRLVLNISLARKRAPQKFTSPVIYSLSTPYYRQNKVADSIKKNVAISNDSIIMRRKEDSSAMALKDSLFAIKLRLAQSSTVSDSTVSKRLDSITGQLKDIKNILRDQQIRPRLQQLQYQSDSIKNLRSRLILVRPINRESSLQLRVYDLQVDSLHNEFERVRLQANPPNVSDTLKINYQPSFPVKQPVTTVYGLQDKALTYDSYDSDARFAYIKKMDSIQQRLNDLERRSAGPDSANLVENRYRNNLTDSSIAAYRQSGEIEEQIKKEEDALLLLQRQLTLTNDSAVYYRTRNENAAAIVKGDTVKKKATWYQRYLGIGNKKTKSQVNADTVYNTDYTTQQQYYEDQLSILNKKMEDMQNSTNDLAEKKLVYDRKNNILPDSTEYVRNLSQVQQRIQRNTDSISLLQRQLKKSNDSSAYYQQQMLATSEKANAENNQKWYQNLFTSEKKRQNRMDAESREREQIIDKQQYYDSDTRNQQQRINDLERRNRDLSNSYQALDAERGRQRFNNTPTVIPIPLYGTNNGENRRDRREIEDLRAELQNLKNEVNYDARGNFIIDTLNKRNYILDTTLAGREQRSQVMKLQQGTVPDSTQVSLLRSELNQLRNQIDSLKRVPAVVAPSPAVTEKPVKTEQKFDVTGFPVISVYFKTGSVALTSDQLNKITPLAQVANKNKEASIVLKGFTDPVGNPAKNKVIANKRSEYTKNYLVTKYKISSNRIIIEEPEGSEGSATKKANPLDRRVDLQFQ